MSIKRTTKMKQTLISITIFVVWSALVYLCFAFIGWQLDPYYWNEGGRIFYVIVGPFIGVLLAFVSLDITDTPDYP